MLGYTASFTNIGVNVLHSLLVASGWDTKDLRKTFTEKDGFTIFAPLDTALTAKLSIDDMVRLKESQWKRHLNDFLKHMVFGEALSQEELIKRTDLAGGILRFPTLSLRDVILSNFGSLAVDGALVEEQPGNIRAVDG